MYKIGIIGGAGYTAGELIRLLINHPAVELSFVQSSSNSGNYLWQVHGGIFGETDMKFCEDAPLDSVDLVFLCSAHGKSREFWEGHPCPEGLKIIDLAQDFRDESQGYVYGLPEWQKSRIASSSRIANPGCFATAIQLALLPLAKAGLLDAEVQVTALTGSTGAGVKPSATTHFSWRDNNLSTYKVFSHQHLIEIRRNLGVLAGSEVPPINFVPVRGDFARGIFASIQTECSLGDGEAAALYEEYYRDSAFTFHCPFSPDLKQVTNTNKCLVHTEIHNGKIVVTSILDNLLKGASGQAVQNMNIILGLDERTGLRLKASAF
ncbi:MAG: N-acetyl-gamma-glutamyl-phosphate reductase [Candidatus Cryptobacteroides sp.]